MSLQPVGEVEVMEVGGDGDAVAVLTGGMTLLIPSKI